MPTVSRRLFLRGGLAAIMVAACGDGTRLTTATPGSPTTAATPPGPGTTSGADPGAVDVMGDHSIVDAVYGTEVTVSVDDGFRFITANGLPDHATGEFPNAGNPNAISPQAYSYRLPLAPTRTGAAPYNVPQSFGVGVNGVPFDPFAAEWYQRDRTSGWQFEATGGGIDLGLDTNNAHVQPTGAYHYHGIPAGLVPDLSPAVHAPLVGWAGDGFPIYVRYGYRDPMDPASPIVDLQSSYRIRSGNRDSGPGGAFDGTYVADYEFVAGLGDLDECNGRFGITPEYPDGTYLHVLTEAYPVIPRSHQAAIDPSFVVGGP